MAFDEAVAERVRDLLEGQSGVSEKRMFGGLAFLINGNMAVSASGQGGLLLRCDPEASDEICARPHVERAVMRGRAMDGWLRVGAEALATDEELQGWVRIGVAYARSLPAKG
ncbi:MAG TPA: TfoX/Sxy family protein [Actinomycetota bacterium]|nr:TfoX/Sxy family protein [Actinomycetota bacterium]